VIPGFSRHIELELLDFLTSQLDRELISHNVMVKDLKKRIDRRSVLKRARVARDDGRIEIGVDRPQSKAPE